MDTVRACASPVFSVNSSATSFNFALPRRIAAALLAALACTGAGAADVSAANPGKGGAPEVVFVCEHGSAKSLVAASLFNQMAQERGLAVRAIARAGSAQTADKSVPATIVRTMAQDGFQVASFKPEAIRSEEAAHARQVVVIAYEGPVDAASGAAVERWNDVAAVGAEYAKAKSALKSHIEQLFVKLGDASNTSAPK